MPRGGGAEHVTAVGLCRGVGGLRGKGRRRPRRRGNAAALPPPARAARRLGRIQTRPARPARAGRSSASTRSTWCTSRQGGGAGAHAAPPRLALETLQRPTDTNKPAPPTYTPYPHQYPPQTNQRFIREYPNLREYVKDLTQARGGAIGRRCARGGAPPPPPTARARGHARHRPSSGAADQPRQPPRSDAPSHPRIPAPHGRPPPQTPHPTPPHPHRPPCCCRPPPPACSINIKHIKTHYFTSHPTLNAYAIIPVGRWGKGVLWG
jgi:hypothetical protein